MKFLVDAQLPHRLAHNMRNAGYDTIHTLDLLEGNRTPDTGIIAVASREQRVVVTKDADFVSSFWLSRRPQKLLLVSTGNITNAELEGLFLSQMAALDKLFADHDLVELTRSKLIIHE